MSAAPAPGPATVEEFRDWFNGLDVMQGLGIACCSLEPGRAVTTLEVAERHRNPGGSVNGGYLLAAADVTAGAAVASDAEVRHSVTSDLTMHFLAAAVEGPLVIEAHILRRGRRTCVPTVRITDATGALCAVATGTWVLRDEAQASAPLA